MAAPLRILLLEDDSDDVELIENVIQRSITNVEFYEVAEREHFLKALEDFKPDMVLSDNQLPQFDATEALEHTRKHSLFLPFILVTGTVSEEFAANIIRMGADDYILKDRMARLPAAIEAAIERRTAELSILSERERSEKEILEINEQLRELTNHIQNIREEESTRIAREIHDQLGQQLTVIKMDASWILKKSGETDPAIAEKSKELISMIDEMIKTVRRISADLRPHLLDELGLGATIEYYLENFSRRSGIKTIALGTKEEADLPDEIKSGLFRILQEALTNVARHANASIVVAEIHIEDNSVELIIEDDGTGFITSDIQKKKTFGLLGMKERVAMMKGSYEISSSPGEGTKVTVKVPAGKKELHVSFPNPK